MDVFPVGITLKGETVWLGWVSPDDADAFFLDVAKTGSGSLIYTDPLGLCPSAGLFGSEPTGEKQPSPRPKWCPMPMPHKSLEPKPEANDTLAGCSADFLEKQADCLKGALAPQQRQLA